MKVVVKMLRTIMGHDVNESGVNMPSMRYEEGCTYEVHESLAKCFVDLGGCELVEEAKKELATKNETPAKAAPKKANHTKKGAPENKSVVPEEDK